MSTEVPIRKKSYRRQLQKVAERTIPSQKEVPLPSDNFTRFVDFLGQTMPPSEQQNFARGANYAKKIIGNFTPEGFELSDETISSFITELIHNAYYYARQRQYQYDFLETVEKGNGKDVLRLSVPYRSATNPDLVEHFTSFEDPYVKLGAFTTLAISEKQQSLQQKPPIELRPNTTMQLQSA